MKEFFKDNYRKYGKKFLIFWGTWFVLKWTAIFLFGKTVYDWVF